MESNANNGSQTENHVIVGVERKADHWVSGSYGDYKFNAKVYDKGSQYGIKGGRISKLCIWHIDRATGERTETANFDRGWEFLPDNEQYITAMTAICFCLNQLPPEMGEEATK